MIKAMRRLMTMDSERGGPGLVEFKPDEARKVKAPAGPDAGGFSRTSRQIAALKPPGGIRSGCTVLGPGSFSQPSCPSRESSGSSAPTALVQLRGSRYWKT